MDLPILQFLVIDPYLDTDAGIDQADQGCRDSDEVACTAIRRAGVSRYVSDQATAYDQCRFCPDDAKGVHGVDDVEHSLRRVSMNVRISAFYALPLFC